MSPMPTSPKYPALGYGLGLRVDYYDELLDGGLPVDWLEILSENYMIPGGRPLHYLARFRERFPLVMHGVSLSIGSVDALDKEYLRSLKKLADFVQPAWISDHLCWTGSGGTNLYDLLPLPYSEEAIEHVVQRVRQVQEFLGRRILLENVSSYVSFADGQLQEWEFLAAIAERADCLILLDINNIFVSAHNHGFDPHTYLAGVPRERVQQFHMAGHEHNGSLIIDTHSAPVDEGVWDLYAHAVRQFGPVSTMIERDDKMPPLSELIAELDRARSIAEPILQAAA
jgi:uncharacterized protein